MGPRLMPLLAGVLTSALATPSVRLEQARPAAGDANWPMFRRDSAGTGYSPLAQITAENVGRLARAWSYALRGAYDGTLSASYSAFAVRLGAIDTNMVVHVAPNLGKGGGQGELDRTLGSAAEAVKHW